MVNGHFYDVDIYLFRLKSAVGKCSPKLMERIWKTFPPFSDASHMERGARPWRERGPRAHILGRKPRKKYARFTEDLTGTKYSGSELR